MCDGEEVGIRGVLHVVMQSKFISAPVVVIGAHRSGTALVVRMLEALGLFVGEKQDVNHEALFFVRFNEWLMHRSGATWDHPEPVRELFTSEHAANARALAQACAGAMIHSPYTVSYLGWRHFLRQRRLDRLRFPWGWKDPRNTFMLPLWQECFPEAKVIHVMRHGVDAAYSLTKRHLEAVAVERRRGPSRRYLITPYRDRFFDTVTCGSLEGSFQVWEQYVSEARRQVARTGSRAIELRFEDLVAQPLSALNTLVDFCGLDASSEALRTTASHVRVERAHAYRSSPRLQEFADSVADRLAIYQYSSDDGD
jgi:LPS sulfotransferase NodH